MLCPSHVFLSTQLQVELKKCKTIMTDAALHLPAAFLHAAFSDRSGVPPGHFELYYRGKRLEGEAALASWGIEKGATIEVKMRGRGGMSPGGSNGAGGSDNCDAGVGGVGGVRGSEALGEAAAAPRTRCSSPAPDWVRETELQLVAGQPVAMLDTAAVTAPEEEEEAEMESDASLHTAFESEEAGSVHYCDGTYTQQSLHPHPLTCLG